MHGRRRLLVAIAASCAVYAVPVVTAHFSDLFGLSLLREFGSDRPAPWVAADVAFAVTVQAVWALVLWLALGVGWGAGVLAFLIASVPVTYAVNVAYLVKIPEIFLIEEDATKARAVLRGDSAIDRLDRLVRDEVHDLLAQASEVESALDSYRMSRELERVGDHLANVGEDVIYLITGEIVRHHASA